MRYISDVPLRKNKGEKTVTDQERRARRRILLSKIKRQKQLRHNVILSIIAIAAIIVFVFGVWQYVKAKMKPAVSSEVNAQEVTSTLYICWAAFAGLFHNYGIPKHVIGKKISGVFRHYVIDKTNPIFRGFDDEFYVPHSRFSEVRKDDILKVPDLKIVAESEASGVYMVMARNGREFYITGHSEYSPLTLDYEYHRDLDKGKNPSIPVNYYPNDDINQPPIVRWKAHANLLFSNWLNYFVYQETPYDIRTIK